MSMNVSQQETQYKKPGVGAIIGGTIAGGLVQNTVTGMQQGIGLAAMQNMRKIASNLTADEFKQIAQATKNVMNTSGLKEAGVSILKANAKNNMQIKKTILKELNGGLLSKNFPKKLKHLLANQIKAQTDLGVNAFFAPLSKKIVMPDKSLGLAFFHEAGHAINANLSKFGKVLQKCRPLAALAIPIALIGLCKTKKAPNEEPKGIIDKVTTFIKNNAGKLTFASFMPIVLEEGLASIHAQKMAKSLLSPELAKKVAKTNAWGFATYAGLAVLAGLGSWLGVKVKDAIASPKPIEQN